MVEDTADEAPNIPELPVMRADDEEESDDKPALMSDAEIDAVNERIPALFPVIDPEEDTEDSDQDASASGG